MTAITKLISPSLYSTQKPEQSGIAVQAQHFIANFFIEISNFFLQLFHYEPFPLYFAESPRLIEPLIISLKADTHSQQTLESEFFQTAVDVNAIVNFKDYLEPNESCIEQARSCFRMNAPGLLVSTGTERSFFGLLQCHENKAPCQGLVIRDINPRVKAYVDFNILLLRLATDCADYKDLSLTPIPNTKNPRFFWEEKKQNICRKIIPIKERLQKNKAIPTKIKAYYLHYFDDLAYTYYSTSQNWKTDPRFPHYHKDQEMFQILKNYAMNEQIVTTLGDINDLYFLSNRNISLIDISNIPNYILIDLQTSQADFQPNVIWTNPCRSQAFYHTYTHEIMPNESKKRLAVLFEKLCRGKTQPGIVISDLLNRFEPEANYLNSQYSMKTLDKLERFIAHHSLSFFERAFQTLTGFHVYNREYLHYSEEFGFELAHTANNILLPT